MTKTEKPFRAFLKGHTAEHYALYINHDHAHHMRVRVRVLCVIMLLARGHCSPCSAGYNEIGGDCVPCERGLYRTSNPIQMHHVCEREMHCFLCCWSTHLITLVLLSALSSPSVGQVSCASPGHYQYDGIFTDYVIPGHYHHDGQRFLWSTASPQIVLCFWKTTCQTQYRIHFKKLHKSIMLFLWCLT